MFQELTMKKLLNFKVKKLKKGIGKIFQEFFPLTFIKDN
jgi:hypothetical protein